MSKSDTYQKSSGLGGIVFALLGLMFIYLKLTGQTVVSTWSWWWALAPFWMPWVAVVMLLAIILGIAGLAMWLDNKSLGR